jgi:DNA-binding NarL/FixJ family response regulator
MTGTTVVVADDSTLVREGVARLLRDEGFDVVGATHGLDELIACVRLTRPDLVVTDIRMPPGRGDEGIIAAGIIRDETGGRTAVLVLSQYLELDFALRVLESRDRATGYLLKDRIVDAAAFVDAARRVTRGETLVDPAIVSALLARSRRPGPLDALSTREREVLGLMAEGRSNSGIADRLYLTEKTVEGYVGAIFVKLGLEAGPDDHRRVLAVLSYLGDRPSPR